MAKKFGESPIAKRFDEVAKDTMANANITSIKLIENSALEDYPENGEDISYTADIENSIAQLGFTDPIEVTDYNMPKGKYMIVSGHRRRAAGIKCGMNLFPCIIKSFDNNNEIRNYVLLSNSQRDSSKDPLLYCRRYKLHEQHLKSINFKGSVREEIAKRLGISVQQADRYNQMNKIIPSVWDLVRKNIAGMSSVLPMAAFSHKEQQDIFKLLKKSAESREELTRKKVRLIIESYKNKKNPHGEDFSETHNAGKTEAENILEDKPAVDVIKLIKTLTNNLKTFNYQDSNKAKIYLNETEKLLKVIFEEFYYVGKVYGLRKEVDKVFENLGKFLKKYE